MASAGDRVAGDFDRPSPRRPGPSLSAHLIDRFSRLGARLEAVAETERDQLPLWLPVGLMLGISAWFSLPDQASWMAFLLACAGLAAGLVSIGGQQRWARALALFSLAAALGCALIWWKADLASQPRLERARMMTFTGRIEQVQPLAAKAIVRLVIAPDPVEGARSSPRRIRLNVDEARATDAFVPGAKVKARAWLMPPAPMAAPGAYDFSRTAWFQGIGASGRAIDIAVVEQAASRGFQARLSGWRETLAAHVRERLGGGGAGGIGAALATGDQYGIPEDDAEAMRRSGLAHLLSVSGLHLTAVVGAVMLLTLKLLALSPMLALRFRLVLVAAGAGALAGIAYTLLTGSEVPTVRACIASLLILAGIALGREALTLRLVAVGALIILLLWPQSVAGPSFQMSFAAMVALISLHENPRVKAWFARRDEAWLSRLGRGFGAVLLTGLVIELALTPIALFHFHKSGLYGALANVVAIPLTTFVVMPLEALALLFDLAGLGGPFWWLTGQTLALLLAIARSASAAPGAVALLPDIPGSAFGLIVAGGLWICLWRTRIRLLGIVPVVAGASWALVTPAPDLIVTGDGRHFVLRTDSGTLALLRPRAGDYVRDTLAELSGSEPVFAELERLPAAACSPDLCSAHVDRGGRRWRILATRTSHHVRWDRMVEACARADIVISDRWLPRGCNPQWLKIDRGLLARTGGLAITFSERPRVTKVADLVGRHPWAQTRPLRGAATSTNP